MELRRLLIASWNFHRNAHKPLIGPLPSPSRFRYSPRYMSCSRLWHTPSAKLDNHGKSLIVRDNGEDSSYHPTWLRHNCQCPSCLAPSGQKTIDLSEITPSITLESVTLLDGRLNLSWSSGHHGYIDITCLQMRRHVSHQNEDLSTPKIATELPVMSAVGLTRDREKLWRWLYFLNEYGVCLLTNMGEVQGECKKLAETMYNVQGTIYGETFHLEAQEDFVNIAYSNQNLTFHMDQICYESPPGLQLLHCLRFDDCVEGGESVMLDMFPVVEELRKEWPKHFNTLSRVPATFQKIHYERENPMKMVSYCPHIQLDRYGKVVRMSWSPPIEGPLDIPKEEVIPYYEAYHCLTEMLDNSKLKLSHRLKPGEAMTFNNRRMLHSRKYFTLNGGRRHLQGAYVNIDHFKSTYEVLCKQLIKTEVPIRRVFNGNST